MIERVLRASFGRPWLTLIVVVSAAGLGAAWLLDLRRDVFPDLSTPVFNVIVQNASMGAEELETAIAVPLETALAGIPGVRRIRSLSTLGVAQVTVEFEAESGYHVSRQLVAERVGQAASQLPPGTAAPLISSVSARLNEILEFTLEADPGAADLMTLRDLAEFEVKNRLLSVPGVAAVERLGGYLRQYQVLIDPDRMSARDVALDAVLHAVEGANVNAAGGFVVRGSTEWAVRAVGRVRSVDELKETVVAVRGTTPVMLSDVADVLEAPAVRRGIAHRLNGEVVSCRVVKQFGADTVEVAAGIRRAIAELREGLPAGVALRIVYDQSEMIHGALSGVGRAILLGAILVVVVLYALLGDLRATLIVTLTLPLSVALAGLLLKPAGVGINTMTLGGLAIAVGLLVDAAIIVTENTTHRLASRASAPGGASSGREVALGAALEVARPIVFATLILIAVFLPLFAMTGIEGRMYAPLAAAVIASVAAALVLALTFVPVASGLLLRPRAGGAGEEVPLIRVVKREYARLLEICLRRAGAVRLVSLAVTVPVLGLAFSIGSDFMPKLDEGALLLQTNLPPEASLEEVDRLNHRVEDLLRGYEDVEEVVRRTGRAERTEDPMPHTLSDILVVLKPDRTSDVEDLEEDMRDRLAKVPGVSVLFTTPLGMRIDEGLGGTPADISVRIFGPDLDELTRLAARAREIMGPVDGIEDLRAERLTGLPQIRVAVDRGAVARAGLTPGDVIRAVGIGLAGQQVGEVWASQRRFDIVVRLRDDRRGDLNAVRSILIDGHDGTRIPLGQLAAVEETFGPGAIRRESGSRRIAVEATVHGRDLGGTASEVRSLLARDLKPPKGYFAEVGGRVESQARASRSLTIAVVFSVLSVFVLLYVALGSAAEALVILATLPDAFAGAILALLIAGESWNVSSLVGLIGLLGIAVQNGLVLVSQTRALVARGRSFPEALHEAAVSRVRPKLMTAATAILGLLPMLVLRLHGTEIERPLAVVMIGGLVTSTLFTLFALPTFYMLVHQLRGRIASRRSEGAVSG